jgi:acetyl-CoA carboxylase biotin carboxylase subunit
MTAHDFPFDKVLVANRGEIACRVFRTCRELGLSTVAVYSDADADALHVREADEAVHIGPTPSSESYLQVDKIIEAAKSSGAGAIHPGYGFLSERPELVAACEAAGITFVGPSAHAMNVMGDKVSARRAMLTAGVPVVPGRDDIEDATAARAAAQEIGFPMMLKASAGGGGKGMRIVREDGEVERAFEAAKREAIASFGDGRIFVERAVERARHVEIQVMADSQGHVLWLNERECSVQRRNQKVIEEAPSPCRAMTPELRAKMGEVACQAARAVDYVGAGTIEFLLEETDDGASFYFLEMNTRLQVEHPVTEAITGRDLVRDQLLVAAGRPLEYGQEDVRLDGHAVECRIYAEDPYRFFPSPGPVHALVWPQGSGLRIDAAVDEGSEVSSHYDPMIAKLTTWGPDRETAIARMRRALGDTTILGIQTNLSFHRRVLEEPDFCAGTFTTGYVAEHPQLCEEAPGPLAEAEAAAAAVAVSFAAALAGDGPSRAPHGGAPGEISAWRRSIEP